MMSSVVVGVSRVQKDHKKCALKNSKLAKNSNLLKNSYICSSDLSPISLMFQK